MEERANSKRLIDGASEVRKALSSELEQKDKEVEQLRKNVKTEIDDHRKDFKRLEKLVLAQPMYRDMYSKEKKRSFGDLMTMLEVLLKHGANELKKAHMELSKSIPAEQSVNETEMNHRIMVESHITGMNAQLKEMSSRLNGLTSNQESPDMNLTQSYNQSTSRSPTPMQMQDINSILSPHVPNIQQFNVYPNLNG